MLTNLDPKIQLTVLSYLSKSKTEDILKFRLVCPQWNIWCVELLQVSGIKVSFNCKHQSKQLLQLLMKKTKFNLIVHHLAVRSKVYLMDFIPIICQCPALKSLDLGGSKAFYVKFYELLMQFEITSQLQDLPSIEEFKFNDHEEIYTMKTYLTSSLINEGIAKFRHSIKHHYVALDYIDVPGLYKQSLELKDGLTEMTNLERLSAIYFNVFSTIDSFIEDILNSRMKKLNYLEITGCGLNLTSRPIRHINPVLTLRELDIVLPCIDVNVLKYIMISAPNLERLCLLSNKFNYSQRMTIIGENPLQILVMMINFSKYCERIPTVIVSILDLFMIISVHIHRESGKEVDFIWGLFEQDEEFDILTNLFD